jgi:hypothetical protein
VRGSAAGRRAAAVLALGLATLGATAPILAAPAPAAAAPAPAPDDEAPSPDHRVSIEVGRFEPRTVTDASPITVSGTLTNTGTGVLRDIDVRLQRGDVLTTRAGLVAADSDELAATSAMAPFERLPGVLRPGESLPFNYATPAEALDLDQDGVYPVLFNVNATDAEGLRRRVGELDTYLIRRPAVPDDQTTVAWLWPVVADSSRAASGGFIDDDLADSVSPGGRLDRTLAVIERLPRSSPSPDEEPVPAVPVTLAVDPALVEELGIMADGPYTVGSTGRPGRGTEAAADFLDRLRALADVHAVLALPYGDVDADALSSVGLADVITRSLPGTARGTAQDPRSPDDDALPAPPTGTTAPGPPPVQSPDGGTTGGAGSASATREPAGDGAATPSRGEEFSGAGARILTEALGVRPGTGLAWAPGGALRSDTVSTLEAGGIEQVVLGPTGMTAGNRAVGLLPGTAAAHTTVETPQGTLDVLVADAALGVVVDTAEQREGGPRLAEQRYLAELALVGQQSADGSSPTVLIAPPREVQAGPDGAGAMMADTAGLPWLQPASVADLLATDPVPAGTLSTTVDAVQLDREGLADVVAAEWVRDDLAGAAVDDPAVVLRSYDAAIARTVSVSQRDDAEEFRAAAERLHRTLARLLERVTLLAPAEGTYSLASSDAPLVLTVQNDLPFAVSVLLDLRTRETRGGIAIADIGPQLLTPGERTTLRIPTEVRQSGGFIVTAALTTPGGTPLGSPVRLQVKSTAYGSISLLITFGAAGLLGLLFLRRLVRFVVRRRRAITAPAPDAPGAEGPLSPVPPSRSPV